MNDINIVGTLVSFCFLSNLNLHLIFLFIHFNTYSVFLDPILSFQAIKIDVFIFFSSTPSTTSWNFSRNEIPIVTFFPIIKTCLQVIAPILEEESGYLYVTHPPPERHQILPESKEIDVNLHSPMDIPFVKHRIKATGTILENCLSRGLQGLVQRTNIKPTTRMLQPVRLELLNRDIRITQVPSKTSTCLKLGPAIQKHTRPDPLEFPLDHRT